MLSSKSGHSVAYLTGPVAGGRESYYSGAVAAGEPRGRWYGSGAVGLGLSGEVDNDLLEAVYSHRIDPRDPAVGSRSTWGEADTLGAPDRDYSGMADRSYAKMLARNPAASPEERSEMRARADRSARQAIAFEDVTFSPAKSVSVLAVALERAANDARAAGDDAAADEFAAQHRAVEDAVMAGARASIDYLEQVAAVGRAGDTGGPQCRWVDSDGFVVAQFLQHDSREHDPQLHVHQAILNRQWCDGVGWRALDGRTLTAHRPAAGSVAERVMEAHLAQSLGVRFIARKDGNGREIDGVGQDMLDLFSKRRVRSITPKVAELTTAFQDRFGREPSLPEQRRLAQQATLATRSAKQHHGETREEFLDRCEAQARAEVGSGLAVVAQVVMDRQQDPAPAQRFSEEAVVQRALDQVLGEERQSWERADLVRAVSDSLPANLGVAPEKVQALLEALTDVAITRAVRLSPEVDGADLTPAQFRRRNGESQFSRPGGTRYTTEGTRADEQYNRAAAVTRGVAAMTSEQVDAIIARYAESGRELGADQATALRGLLTSGAQVSVVTAPAGSGKTFLMGALAEALPNGRVIGLAPSQVAANQLADEGLGAWNTTAWLRGSAADSQPATGDFVVVDEASMATNRQMREIEQRCGRVGANLIVVGDPRQLAQVGPGGALSDLAERAAHYELTEVRRQREEWERKASLRLRDGDVAALAEYDKHGRLIAGGTAEQAEQAAGRAWLADTLAGNESLLLVGSNEQAAKVSAALRRELVGLGRVEEQGVELGLQGVVAGVGDLVQGRRNGWDHIGWEGNRQAPLNRDTYRVTAIRDDGGLVVRRPGVDGSELNLSSEYVANHLALGYASTTHAAQGRTVDTCHDTVGTYVGMTRGRESNTAWLTTRPTAVDAEAGEAQSVHERSARAVMADRLEAHQEQRSALAEQEQLADDARSTATHLGQLIAGAQQECSGRTSRILDSLVDEGVLSERDRTDLAAGDGMGALDRLVRTAELAGHEPEGLLRQAVAGRGFSDARVAAHALHYRITSTHEGALTPSITSARDLIPAGVIDEQDRAWLERRADAIDTRRAELGQQLSGQPEPWAVDALGHVPDDLIERLEWERKAGWGATYRELVEHTDDTDPLGPAPPVGLPEFSALFHRAHAELDLPEAGAEEAGLSDGRLRNRIAAYERDEAWAPRYVADDLADIHRARAAAETNAELWEARAAALEDPAGRRHLQVAAAAERAKANEAAKQADQLGQVDDARARWYAHTALERDIAERARCELGNRGVDLAGEPRVTAADWLAAHDAAMLEQDQRDELAEAEVVERAPRRSAREWFTDATARVLAWNRPTVADEINEVELCEQAVDEHYQRELNGTEQSVAADELAGQELLQAAGYTDRPDEQADPADDIDDFYQQQLAEREIDEEAELEMLTAAMVGDPMAAPPETAVPDIRETSAADPTEHTAGSDPLSVDDTAAAVQRAAEAEAELRNREDAESARWHEEAVAEEERAEAQVAVDA